MNRKLYLFIIMMLLLMGNATVLAQEHGAFSDGSEGRQKFELYVGCQPIFLVVEEPTPDGKEIGLSRSQIRTAAEARLRGARIFSDKMTGRFFLHIQVFVARQAFHVQLSFVKLVMDYLSQREGGAFTWKWDVTGTHASDGPYIMSVVSRALDEFIVEYFRANQDACDQKP